MAQAGVEGGDMDTTAAIVAGLVGAGIMSVVLYMGIALMPNQMKMNLFLMLGTMMLFRGGPPAYVMGAMVHFVMGIVFGLIHVALYQAFGLESALVAWGLLFGLAHWLITGMTLGMLPTVHGLIRSGEMAAPGAMALKYPPMTATGYLMLHLLFGVAVAAVYSAMSA